MDDTRTDPEGRSGIGAAAPTDLVVVAAVAVAAAAVNAYAPDAPARWIVGLPLAFFLPGYVITVLLFPERHAVARIPRGNSEDDGERVRRGLTTVERLALSVGLSLATVPFVGLALVGGPWGIRQQPAALLLAALVLAGALGALVRRRRIPPEERPRFRLRAPPVRWETYDGANRALTIGLVLGLVATAGLVATQLVQPHVEEGFTEFYLLSGEWQADPEAYPSNLSVNETGLLRVGVTNREHAPMEYTLRIEADGDVLDRWNFDLGPDEVRRQNVTVRFEDPGVHRIDLLLDRAGVDESPYRALHIWVKVQR